MHFQRGTELTQPQRDALIAVGRVSARQMRARLDSQAATLPANHLAADRAFLNDLESGLRVLDLQGLPFAQAA